MTASMPLDRLRHCLWVADVALHKRDVTDGGPVPEFQGVEGHHLSPALA
jgi:hypothetical protein